LSATRVCGSPDGREWCGAMDSRVQSGFQSGTTVGFMWTASQGGGFAKPYTRISTFDTATDLTHLEDIDIWSSTVGFVHASAAVNSLGQIGGTILWGGSADYQSCSAWIADSPTSASLAPFESLISVAGASGPSTNRSGDYTWTNVAYPNTDQFIGACFALSSPSRAVSTFVNFGRASTGVSPFFADGFESAGTDGWTVANP
jgi:hypothetical protein